MEQKKNNMATASLVVGILSIVTSCCCCVGVVIGALAVALACLSKVDEHMEGKARAGLITGIAGMILGVVFLFIWMMAAESNVATGEGYSMNYHSVVIVQALLRGGIL